MVSEAIAQGDVQAINYFVAQKYIEAISGFATSPNEKLVFMPMEASGVIGAIGGIAELAKSALAESQTNTTGNTIQAVSRTAEPKAYGRLLANVDHWNWWILALLMFVIELAMPGVIFLWLAIAATITGALVWIIPELGWQVSFVIFAVLSVIASLSAARFGAPVMWSRKTPHLTTALNNMSGRRLP